VRFSRPIKMQKLTVYGVLLALAGCATGLTGYAGRNASVRSDHIEYRFIHPGLDIRVRVKNSTGLIVPKSVGEDKNKSFRHTINFGRAKAPSQLLIIGRFEKSLQLNSICFETVTNGKLLVEGERVWLNEKELSARPCA